MLSWREVIEVISFICSVAARSSMLPDNPQIAFQSDNYNNHGRLSSGQESFFFRDEKTIRVFY
jgi:hypothetical protein